MAEEYSNTEDPSLEDGEITSTEEAFMKGYNEEREIDECAECGSGIEQGKGLSREIAGEMFTFCTQECQVEFEEGVVE